MRLVHSEGSWVAKAQHRPVGRLARRMPGKPLRSQLNQIRAWVREGRTDAWIAHQLEISASELREFRRRNDLKPDSEPDTSDDLRDEIEAEVEAATLAAAEASEAEVPADVDDEGDDDDGDDEDSSEDGDDRPGAVAAAVAAAAASEAEPPSRRPSTTARRTDTASGWTRPSRTTPSTPRTGPVTARCA